MAYGQYLAGIAFNNASLGYVHAMAHQLGGFYNLPHGVCNAILLPYVERFNLIRQFNRFRDIAEAMGENIEGFFVHPRGSFKSHCFYPHLKHGSRHSSYVEGIGSKTRRLRDYGRERREGRLPAHQSKKSNQRTSHRNLSSSIRGATVRFSQLYI